MPSVALALVVLVLAATPATAMVTGVDVASFQHPSGGPIDWRQVRDAGHSFAFVKATESTTYTNPYFAGDWRGAGDAGLHRGAYHFARPKLPLSSAVDQARYFVSRTGTMQGGRDLPGVLDLETTGGLGRSDLAEWTRRWLAEVERLTGKAPIIYTGYYFWRDNLGDPVDIGERYRLWLPSYPADPDSTTFRPLVPAGWSAWTFWQYTSTGSVPGIVGSVDLNRFCCDLGSLSALGGDGSGAGRPFGSLDAATRLPRQVRLEGWTIDPDTTAPIDVHVYVDGNWAARARADVIRPDVGDAYPGYRAAHGYSLAVAVGPGDHRVCAYAIDVGPGGGNPELGCETVPANPVGSLDQVRAAGPGQVTVEGWAVDPDTDGTIAVDVYSDGRMAARSQTGVGRDDVAQAFSVGHDGGYAVTLRGQPTGPREVCAYAVNVGWGDADTLLGCRTVTVEGGSPSGNFEATSPIVGGARLQGWAVDPDTTGPVDVHVYVDGRWTAVGTADVQREDLGAAFPLMGPRHGFALDVRMPTGTHEVCVYAIDRGSSAPNPMLGCRSVTVSGAPVGNWESVIRWNDILLVKGWALDPDTWESVTVRFAVDGRELLRTTAGDDRPDVGAVYPHHGPAHGFQSYLFTTPGPHTVCVTAVNLGAGTADTTLGCRTV